MTLRARAYARWEHARTPGCEPESAAKLSPREGTQGAFVSESSFVQKSTTKHLRRVYLSSPVAVSSSPFSQQQQPSTANHAPLCCACYIPPSADAGRASSASAAHRRSDKRRYTAITILSASEDQKWRWMSDTSCPSASTHGGPRERPSEEEKTAQACAYAAASVVYPQCRMSRLCSRLS
ncbi:hypothetical protein BC827DRAFT_1173575 [Russula dissimulans]|nr:hypothetical protein BC827DRAFT_1173575 [Russula dissimulans]